MHNMPHEGKQKPNPAPRQATGHQLPATSYRLQATGSSRGYPEKNITTEYAQNKRDPRPTQGGGSIIFQLPAPSSQPPATGYGLQATGCRLVRGYPKKHITTQCAENTRDPRPTQGGGGIIFQLPAPSHRLRATGYRLQATGSSRVPRKAHYYTICRKQTRSQTHPGGRGITPSYRLPATGYRLPAVSTGRSSGNRITSRIDFAPVNIIVSRSIPIPSPAVGGIP